MQQSEGDNSASPSLLNEVKLVFPHGEQNTAVT